MAAVEGRLAFKRIVYATDFTAESEKAARAALTFAAHDGATIYACHVIDCKENPAETVEEDVVREELERLMAKSPLGEYGCELMISHGAPAEAILAMAETVNADLIVMGPRKHSFWLTHVKRGVTLEVLAQARCPVLTVHEGEMDGRERAV